MLTIICAIFAQIKLFLVIYCCYKTKNFIDYWEIHNEFKFIAITIIIFVFLIALIVILTFMFSNLRTEISVVYGMCYQLFTMTTWYWSVIWVNNVNNKKSSIANAQTTTNIHNNNDDDSDGDSENDNNFISIPRVLENPNSM